VYLTLAGVGAGLIFASIVEWEWVPLVTAAAGGLLFANAFFLIWLVTTKFAGMIVLGFGDVRLAAVLGLMLGWYGLPYVLYGALAGHLLAVAVAIATCIHKRKLHVRYSFGPPLIAGTLAVVLFGA
jgi:leader peptidase (prepilin peptidase)/N-methyltransferase